jgi:hypothetical protein
MYLGAAAASLTTGRFMLVFTPVYEPLSTPMIIYEVTNIFGWVFLGTALTTFAVGIPVANANTRRVTELQAGASLSEPRRIQWALVPVVSRQVQGLQLVGRF